MPEFERESNLEEATEPSEVSSALEFDGISYWDDEKGFVPLDARSQAALFQYLADNFGVSEMHECGPYLVLHCKILPEAEHRPFTVAGCVAVWLDDEEGIPAEIGLGDLADGDDMKLPDEIRRHLHPYKIPPVAILMEIANFFPDAFLTFLNTGLIVELPEQDPEAYYEALQTLPGGIAECGITLGYNNGSLPSTALMRIKKLKPQTLNGQADDTNYIETQGCFYPGSMLSSTAGSSISAGVLVHNGEKRRLTVAFHCWEEEHKKTPDKLGNPNYFKVIQGPSESGTTIGYIDERYNSSDIGLVHLAPDRDFQNRFLDITADAKSLLKADEIDYADEFMIDSFSTGKQKLKCLGRRVRPAGDSKREREFDVPKGSKSLLQPPGKYVALVQGIYATSTPVMKSGPMIREGVCGSAIVRSRHVGKEAVLEEGQVGGFMQFSDLKSKTFGGELLCYCEALDNMIDDGWKVVPIPGKRKAEDETEEQEQQA